LAQRLPTWVVVAIAAALFGAIHLPDLPLTAATTALGAILTPIYLRWRNVWPLGVGHGLLGALFYVEVLGRDPWAEATAALL
jgi:membrane protease YdiL (CAAX protease family)